jgi:type VI secretion system protein ImpG
VRRRGWRQKCEIVIFFDRGSLPLERSVDAGTFRLGCTPLVNLFPHTAELVSLSPRQHDYRVVPDTTRGHGLEVYSIDSVRGSNPTEKDRLEVPPFFSIRHPGRAQVYWHMSRSPSLLENDQGTFVDLHLVDQHFQPRLPAVPALEVRTTCSNRDLPNELRAAGDALDFELEAAAPLAGIRLLRTLTPPLRPKSRRGRYWRLVSHFSLNHLSLLDGDKARQALQEILSLYDFSDPDAGQQQLSEVTRRYIEGITQLRGQRLTSRLRPGQAAGGPAPVGSGLSRGVEVTMEFDEEKYPGVGVFLFASVLERFLGLYVASHSFTQLAARTVQRRDYLKIWPPRPGEMQCL